MANLFGAIKNVRKYGFKNTVRSSLQTPGGFLDATEQNPNNALLIQTGVQPGSKAAGDTYYNTQTGQWQNFPVLVSGLQTGTSDAATYGPQTTQQTATAPTLPGTVSPTGTGGTGGAGTFSQIFQGTLYNDPTAYTNALNAAIEAEYQRQLNSLNQTFGQNIGNFAQGRDNLNYDYNNNLATIGSARDAALNSQSGYFSSIAPDAYQTGQDTYMNKTQADYTSGLNDLNRNRDLGLQQLDTGEQNYRQNYQDTLAGLEANKQQLLDQAGNANLDFTNKVGAASANVPQFDTLGVVNNLAKGYFGGLAAGFNPDELKTSIKNSLGQYKLNQSDRNAIENYLYNYINRPEVQKYYLG